MRDSYDPTVKGFAEWQATADIGAYEWADHLDVAGHRLDDTKSRWRADRGLHRAARTALVRARHRLRTHAGNSTSSPSPACAPSLTAGSMLPPAHRSRRSGPARAQDTVTPDWSLYDPARNFK